ncbi:type I-E CRISPR-associated protein Cse1/CasA [Tessaracoccus sp. Z1128]
MTFNLASSSWVPVVTASGPAQVSLQHALAHAPLIKGLDFGNPLAGGALARLLVAIVVDAFGPVSSTEEWRRLFEAGSFDRSVLDSYFEEHYDRFDLLGGPHPFYQVAEIEPASGEWKSVTLLIPEIATGNNVPLFTSVLESTVEALSPAEAARGLVTIQAWDTAAIKSAAVGDPRASRGKTTGNPTGPLGHLGLVLPEGRNLFESLVLETPVKAEQAGDLPAWRREWSAEWNVHQPRGIRELLTWQSRRIRLIGDTDGITGVLVAAGDRMDFVPPHLEPHAAWRIDTKGAVSHRPRRHISGRSAWRGMDALLASDAARGGDASGPCALRNIGTAGRFLPDDYPLGVLCIGVEYGNQSAVFENVIFDRIPMPLRALEDLDGLSLADDLIRVVATAESLRRLVNDLQSDIRRACGGDKIPWDKGDHRGDSMMSEFDEPTRWLLLRLQEEPDKGDEALADWRRTARAITWTTGNRLLDAAPPRAVAGVGPKKDPFTLARAEAFFRGALKKIIPHSQEEEA